MIELRFYLVALACAFWKQFNELLALVVPKHNALSVSRCRDVLGRTKKAEEFLLDFHEGGTAQAHRRGDLTQIDRFAVLLPAAEHAVAASLPRDAAVGTAGVPGAGLIMTTIVFTQVGIPLEAVALIAGIDRILDMIRTSINVVGDVASALVVTNLEGDLNKEPYQEGEA